MAGQVTLARFTAYFLTYSITIPFAILAYVIHFGKPTLRHGKPLLSIVILSCYCRLKSWGGKIKYDFDSINEFGKICNFSRWAKIF